MIQAPPARLLFRVWLLTLIAAGAGVAAEPSGADDLPPLPRSGPPAASGPPPGLPEAIEESPAAPESPRPGSGASATSSTARARARMLDRPVGPPVPPEIPSRPFADVAPWRTPVDPPSGYTGPSGVLPSEGPTDSHFVPVEDRWRIGYPEWDRYGNGHPLLDDYPYAEGRLLDVFNQNVFKGDFPAIGQHLFVDFTPGVIAIQEFRQVPTATTPFESTSRPNEENFFGRPNQFFSLNNFFLAVDLTHGDAAFKQPDWRLRLVPTFNLNNLSVEELGIVSPNVLQGTSRTREWFALQEAFFETKIADVGPDFDIASVRIGNQPFNQDFRGFLFLDTNRAIRFFGTRNAGRDQWNIAYFRQWEKDINSFLNSFDDRRQDLVFLNYYRQDFFFPGYTAQVSLSINHDPRSVKYDKNRFLVRPDPVGIARPHEVDVAYLGWAGDGHFGRLNITHQFYWALGRDSLNPMANQAQTINAQMFAIEGSIDRDWVRFRASFFFASGDSNINNSHATGFDTILDFPNFSGGQFSYWNRQQIPLFGVNLVQRLSLVPDLRSNKFQGQSNFVNPGILIPTVGADLDLTPKLKMFNNVNVLWFDHTNVLEHFLFQGNIDQFVGTDLSTGFEYRPLLSENVSFILGSSLLIPGQGLRDIYNNFSSRVPSLFGGFLSVSLLF